MIEFSFSTQLLQQNKKQAGAELYQAKQAWANYPLANSLS